MMQFEMSQDQKERYAVIKKRYKLSLSKRRQLMEKLENARHKICHLQGDTEKLIDAWSELEKRILFYKKKEKKKQRKQDEQATSDFTDLEFGDDYDDDDDGEEEHDTDHRATSRDDDSDEPTTHDDMGDSLSDSTDWSGSSALELLSSSSVSEDEEMMMTIPREHKKSRGKQPTSKGKQQQQHHHHSATISKYFDEEDRSHKKEFHDDSSDLMDEDQHEQYEDEDEIDMIDSEKKGLTIIDSIPMNEHHQVVFPFSVGKGVSEVHILNLGQVVPDKAGYFTARYVFPLGFTSRRRYLSCKYPGQRTTYTNRILMTDDRSEFPLFEVVADDDLTNPIRGHSCSGVWKTVKMRANETRKTPIKNASPSGPDYFGLSYPLVTFLIQRLPHVTECKKYIFQEFEWKGIEPTIPDHAMQLTPPPIPFIETNLPALSPEETESSVL